MYQRFIVIFITIIYDRYCKATRTCEKDGCARAAFVYKYIFLRNLLYVVLGWAGSMAMNIATGYKSKDVTMGVLLVFIYLNLYVYR